MTTHAAKLLANLRFQYLSNFVYDTCWRRFSMLTKIKIALVKFDWNCWNDKGRRVHSSKSQALLFLKSWVLDIFWLIYSVYNCCVPFLVCPGSVFRLSVCLTSVAWLSTSDGQSHTHWPCWLLSRSQVMSQHSGIIQHEGMASHSLMSWPTESQPLRSQSIPTNTPLDAVPHSG